MADTPKNDKDLSSQSNNDSARDDLDNFTVLQEEMQQADLSADEMEAHEEFEPTEDVISTGGIGVETPKPDSMVSSDDRSLRSDHDPISLTETDISLQDSLDIEKTVETQAVKDLDGISDDVVAAPQTIARGSEALDIGSDDDYTPARSNAQVSDSDADAGAQGDATSVSGNAFVVPPTTVRGSNPSSDDDSDDNQDTPPANEGGDNTEAEVSNETSPLQIRVSNATDNQRFINSEDGYDLKPGAEFGEVQTVDGQEMDIAGVRDSAEIEYVFTDANTVEVTLKSGWNSVKNIEIESDGPANVTVNNFVHADVTLGDGGDSSVVVNDAKRGNIITGDGNDSIDVTTISNGSGWSNQINVSSGEGEDAIHLTGDRGVTEFIVDAGADNDHVVIDGQYYGSQVHLGDGRDTLLGGEGNDNVDGGAGHDRISTGAGDDVIDGGTGNDRVNGGRGDDTIDGGAGNDVLRGGAGDDVVDGGAGNDRINGGQGNDTLSGGDGSDRINGGAGNDKISAGSGNDRVNGGRGDDTIDGGAGNDVLRGGAGDDVVDGGAGNDRINGGQGNDTLSGGDGNDVLRGGAGDDVVDGGAGNDRINGGQGNDTLNGGDGNDRINGGAGNDKISAGSGNDRVNGGRGDDTIDGGAGNDVLRGGAGDDVVDGGAGNDRINGGQGNDTLSGGDGNDVLRGGAGDDVVDGGAGNDRINGGQGNDTLSGGDGNDRINGGQGNDTLSGGDGNDVLRGGAGDDIIDGGDGADIIDGGAGNDTIIVGRGDTIKGGSGQDTFVVGKDDGNVVIKDFGGVGGGGRGEAALLPNHDTLKLDGEGLDPENMIMEYNDGDTIISFEGVEGFSITLENFDFTDLDNLPANSSFNILFDGQEVGDDSYDVLNNHSGGRAPIWSKDGVSHMNDADNVVNGKDNSDDVINGMGGDDKISGGSGDDLLRGQDGQDELTGGAGDDRLSGGDGEDTAVFSGNVTDYDITQNEDGSYTVKDTVDGRDGTDTVDTVENFKFADGEYNGDDMVTASQQQEGVETTVELNFVKNSAGYKNTVGVYKIGEDGVIENAHIAYDNARATDVGETFEMSVTGTEDAQFGFFLIANGASKNRNFAGMDLEGDNLQFVYDHGGDGERPATIHDDPDEISLVYNDGDQVVDLRGDIYHDTPELNYKDLDHVQESTTEDGAQRIGFEDLKNLGDRDFDDVVFDVNVSTKRVILDQDENDLETNSENDDTIIAGSDSDNSHPGNSAHDGNNGHGNDADGVDASNPGNGRGRGHDNNDFDTDMEMQPMIDQSNGNGWHDQVSDDHGGHAHSMNADQADLDDSQSWVDAVDDDASGDSDLMNQGENNNDAGFDAGDASMIDIPVHTEGNDDVSSQVGGF